MNKKQIDKFREAAREAECDLDEKAFDRTLQKVAKSKPRPPPDDGENSKAEKPGE